VVRHILNISSGDVHDFLYIPHNRNLYLAMRYTFPGLSMFYPVGLDPIFVTSVGLGDVHGLYNL